MRVPSRSATALSLLIVIIACGSSQPSPTAAPADARVTVPGEANGVLLAPGGTAVLAVKVSAGSGSPLPSVRVLFDAPPSGPSGTFDGAQAATPNHVVVTTDGSGAATATFHAGAQNGIFLVDAILDAGFGTSFGVTVTGAPAPALDPAAARTAVLAGPLGSPPDGTEQFLLHGPVLLDAGAVVTTTLIDPPPSQLTVARPSWFFWADTAPTAKFEHATRFLLLDASADAGQAVSGASDGAYQGWPAITPAGSPAVDLLPPSKVDPAIVDDPAQSLTTQSLPSVTPVLRMQGPPVSPANGCAVVLHGPPNWAFFYDDEHVSGAASALGWMRFGDTGSPVGVTCTLPGVGAYVASAVAAGCKDLLFYASYHGAQSALSCKEQGDLEYGEDYDGAPSVAQTLENDVGGKGIRVHVVLDACRSGAAIHDFQGRGFDGDIATAADQDSEADSWPWGSVFTNALAPALVQAGGSLSAAFKQVEAAGSSRLLQPRPQYLQLNGTPTNWALPAITLTPGATQQVTFTLPPGVALDQIPGTTVFGKVTVDDATIADMGAPTIGFAKSNSQASKPATGHKVGSTVYRVLVRTDDHAYAGAGTLTVVPPGDGGADASVDSSADAPSDAAGADADAGACLGLNQVCSADGGEACCSGMSCPAYSVSCCVATQQSGCTNSNDCCLAKEFSGPAPGGVYCTPQNKCCGMTPAQSGLASAPCNSAADCCSGPCTPFGDGPDAGGPPGWCCLPYQSACTIINGHSDCCDGIVGCQAHPAFSGTRCCIPDGIGNDACTLRGGNSSCCSGYCDPVRAQCCTPSGQPCNTQTGTTSGCCSGSCNQSTAICN